MILVDTSVWIDYFNGRKNIHTEILDSSIKEKKGITTRATTDKKLLGKAEIWG